jgi:hypothetical protein
MTFTRRLFGKLAIVIAIAMTVAGIGHRHQPGTDPEQQCAVCVWSTPGSLAAEAPVELPTLGLELEVVAPAVLLLLPIHHAVELRSRGPPSVV